MLIKAGRPVLQKAQNLEKVDSVVGQAGMVLNKGHGSFEINKAAEATDDIECFF